MSETAKVKMPKKYRKWRYITYYIKGTNIVAFVKKVEVKINIKQNKTKL